MTTGERLARIPPDALIDAIEPAARARRHKGLLAYVHVPFCTSKCHFCDWVSRYPTADLTSRGDLLSRYVSALIRQIQWYGPRLEALGYHVTDVYRGGGTPTRLRPDELAAVGRALADSFDTARVTEHTVECSPETISLEKLDVLKEAGVNRISIGVQSFDDHVLRRMGRAHDASCARRAIAMAQSAGFENINIDLIAGFADQPSESTMRAIEEAITLQIPHVSVYLFRGLDTSLVSVKQLLQGVRSLDARQAAEALTEARATLAAAGYEQYAIASFARDRRFWFDGDQHYYGQRGDYVGFGAGAESFLGRHSILQAASRTVIDVREYVEDPLSMGVMRAADRLTGSGAAHIRLLQALSTHAGIAYGSWTDQLGFDADALRRSPALHRVLGRLRAAGGAVIEDDDGVRLDPSTAADAINRVHAEELSAGPLRL